MALSSILNSLMCSPMRNSHWPTYVFLRTLKILQKNIIPCNICLWAEGRWWSQCIFCTWHQINIWSCHISLFMLFMQLQLIEICETEEPPLSLEFYMHHLPLLYSLEILHKMDEHSCSVHICTQISLLFSDIW